MANPYYRRIKAEMRARKIIVADIAKAAGLSLDVVNHWMQRPENEARAAIIEEAVKHIIQCRENGEEITSIHGQLSEMGLLSAANVRTAKPKTTAAKGQKKKPRKKPKAKPSEKSESPAHGSVFGRYTEILPWKGASNKHDK